MSTLPCVYGRYVDGAASMKARAAGAMPGTLESHRLSLTITRRLHDGKMASVDDYGQNASSSSSPRIHYIYFGHDSKASIVYLSMLQSFKAWSPMITAAYIGRRRSSYARRRVYATLTCRAASRRQSAGRRSIILITYRLAVSCPRCPPALKSCQQSRIISRRL